MELKAGSRWKSAVCETEVIVVRPPQPPATLECGGRAMLPHNAPRHEGGAVAPQHAAGTLLGKRYVDEDYGIEVLCTKPGRASLSIGGRALATKEARPLPSSD